MTAPELSVVIPTHNVAEWIGECVRSILIQEGVALEVVVVDDGSADTTPVIVAAFDDPRVRLFTADQPGGGPARNQGVTLARGQYLAFADGDDVVPQGAYAALVGSLRASGSDMAVGNFVRFVDGDDGHLAPPVTRHVTAFRTGITIDDEPTLLRNRSCWNRVFRRSFWDSEKILFEDSRRSNDIVAMVRATMAARIDLVPRIVYHYRQRFGHGSMTTFGATAEAQLFYLTQEQICARLLADMGERVRTVYSGMLLRSYVWNAVRIVLQDQSLATSYSDVEIRSRLIEPLADILDQLSPTTFASLPRARRQVFIHTAAGNLPQAHEALRRVTSPTSAERALATAGRVGQRVGHLARRTVVGVRRRMLGVPTKHR